jgi:ribonuclease HI
MSKQKFYVVWKGRKTGVFDSWEECNAQIKGFAGAEFKSFKTRAMADEAFGSDSNKFIGQEIFETTLSKEALALIGDPIAESICVDAAWNTMTGVVEYRGVATATGKELFHMGPFEDGTINIAEFLSLVHGLAYCKQKGLLLPIYSDSRNAIGWVRDKEVRTQHERSAANEELFELVDRALAWLNANEYPNEILKWETAAWGENKADFGRK